MKNKGLKAVVIGGGVHGLSSSISLARENIKVTLLERCLGLMEGSSRATQNRAHLGYHYPRSPETAIECIKGLKFFEERYPSALFYVGEDYYLIEKNESKTSFEEFKRFCDEVGLPYKIEMPVDELYNKEFIDGSFKVNEPVYNPEILKRLLEKEALEEGVEIHTEAEVVGSEEDRGEYKVISLERGELKEYKANLILNSTYANTNKTLKALNLEEDMIKYYLQNTEVVLARNKKTIPALTIVDGPFVTLLPFIKGEDSKLFLVYDVLNSILKQKEGFFLEDSIKSTNWTKMVNHGDKYFPFFRDLEYICSLYGSRPIPVEVVDDSRQTRIKAHKKFSGIYSILEGKFISAPLIAEELVKKMRSDGVISD
jgi:hypothetical protein